MLLIDDKRSSHHMTSSCKLEVTVESRQGEHGPGFAGSPLEEHATDVSLKTTNSPARPERRLLLGTEKVSRVITLLLICLQAYWGSKCHPTSTGTKYKEVTSIDRLRTATTQA